MPCRHCGNTRSIDRRNLCQKCYRKRSTINRYKPLPSSGYTGLLADRNSYPLPEPTDVMPGTPEKIAVMIDRAERGLAVLHPEDRRYHAK